MGTVNYLSFSVATPQRRPDRSKRLVDKRFVARNNIFLPPASNGSRRHNRKILEVTYPEKRTPIPVKSTVAGEND